MGMAAVPLERATNLRLAMRRLIGRLRLERAGVVAIGALAVASVSAASLGPRVLGRGTDIIIRGLGDGGPGAIDFGHLHRVLAGVVGRYLAAAGLSYLQAFVLTGIVQRTMYRLRRDVEN